MHKPTRKSSSLLSNSNSCLNAVIVNKFRETPQIKWIEIKPLFIKMLSSRSRQECDRTDSTSCLYPPLSTTIIRTIKEGFLTRWEFFANNIYSNNNSHVSKIKMLCIIGNNPTKRWLSKRPKQVQWCPKIPVRALMPQVPLSVRSGTIWHTISNVCRLELNSFKHHTICSNRLLSK